VKTQVGESTSSAPPSNVWRAKRSYGGLIGVSTTAGLLVLGVACILAAVRQPPGPAALCVFLLAAFTVGGGAGFGAAALSYFRLGYEFRPGRLLIHWAGGGETVLLADIDGIYGGQRVGPLGKVRGVNWPGYYVGSVRSRTLGAVRAYCTDKRVDALSVIVTSARTIVLSPDDPSGFRRELIRRIEQKTEAGTAAEAENLAAPAGSSGILVIGLATGSLVLLASCMLSLWSNYPGVLESISLTGLGADTTSARSLRSDLAWLPILGAAILGLNLLFSALCARRERAATVVLLASGALAEAVLLVATLRAVG